MLSHSGQAGALITLTLDIGSHPYYTSERLMSDMSEMKREKY